MAKKVLIIEDDAKIVALERDYLEASGLETDTAADGVTGLQKALEGHFALILLDLMLPGLDGFSICSRIREVKDTPILMVSARKEDFDKIRGLGVGADDYIVKPFSPSELVARVFAHISRYERLTLKAEEEENDVIAVGNLSIDKKSRRVYVKQQEIVLTNKEFELLLFLAVHPNVVFDKEKIFGEIWKFDSMGETSTVTVHVNRIRDKIKEIDPNAQYIETVWGAGYRFKE